MSGADKLRCVIVDYSKGNLRSVQRGLELAGAEAIITADASEILKADAIVLPGVGSFADASANMLANGQMQAIRERLGGITANPVMSACEPGRDSASESVRELGREPGRDSASESVRELGREPGREATSELGREPGREATSEPGRENTHVTRGLPNVAFLGICLGLQLLFEYGDEGSSTGPVEGLGLLKGSCRRIDATDAEGRTYKVPHVGWNQIRYSSNNPALVNILFKDVEDGSNFYFTHSYQAEPTNSTDVIATVSHATDFTCAVGRANILATQFHPEKSSHKGLVVLRNFVRFAMAVKSQDAALCEQSVSAMNV